MAFSKFLAIVPLLLGAIVGARITPGGNDGYNVSGVASSIPTNWTVPLAPLHVATTGLPPPGTTYAQALPPPPTNVTLKYVALFRGVWNYTCENSTDAAVPDSVGGLGTLYDLNPLLPYLKSEDDLHKIPTLAVNVTKPDIQKVFNVEVLGTFYHASPHTAIIDLGKKGYLTGESAGILVRVDGAYAPKGPDGSGALGWLIGNALPGSVGIKEFYRVEVAGGIEPESCEGRPFLNSREFACEYWIYY